MCRLALVVVNFWMCRMSFGTCVTLQNNLENPPYISSVGKPWIHVDLLEGICLPRWYRSFFVPWDPIISICFLVSSYLIFGTPMVPCPDHILFSNPKWVCPRLRFSPKSSGSKAHASHEHRCIGAYHIPFRIDSNMSPTLLKKP